MAIFKCKMCGGDLDIAADAKIVECEYCGTTQTVPSADNEKKLNLFNRANRLRLNSEFDKAAGIYENIIAEFSEEAEAYWGLCLCNYGIEYVDDPATAKKVPTCHRASFEKLSDDENFNMAMEYADVVAQKIYRDEAREIDRIMDEILSISKNEKPYDVFICYKETDSLGERTIDSVLAQDIYDSLTAKGKKVFFARITLEDKLGQLYEPYIFSALNSAKVMLAVGTKYEYFHAVWVKNEWSRFLKLMAKDKSKVLIPCYKDMDAYDMPDEFKALQAQDMSKIGFMQDLLRGIEKITGDTKETAPAPVTVAPAQTQNSTVAPLLERAFMFLEDGKWENADEYCEKVLDLEPKNAEAYLGKLLCNYRKRKIKELISVNKKSLTENENFVKVKRYGDEKLLKQVDDLLEAITQSESNQKLIDEKLSVIKKLKDEQISLYTSAEFISQNFLLHIHTESEKTIAEKENLIKHLAKELNSLGFFKMKEKAELQEKIDAERMAVAKLQKEISIERNNIVEAKRQEQKKAAKEKSDEIDVERTKLQEELYQFGLNLSKNGDIESARKAFKGLGAYKDSVEKFGELAFDTEDQDDGFEVECPSCGEKIYINETILDEGSVECPACREKLEFEFES